MIKLIEFIRWYIKYDLPVYISHLKYIWLIQYKKRSRLTYFDLYMEEEVNQLKRELLKLGYKQ